MISINGDYNLDLVIKMLNVIIEDNDMIRSKCQELNARFFTLDEKARKPTQKENELLKKELSLCFEIVRRCDELRFLLSEDKRIQEAKRVNSGANDSVI